MSLHIQFFPRNASTIPQGNCQSFSSHRRQGTGRWPEFGSLQNWNEGQLADQGRNRQSAAGNWNTANAHVVHRPIDEAHVKMASRGMCVGSWSPGIPRVWGRQLFSKYKGLVSNRFTLAVKSFLHWLTSSIQNLWNSWLSSQTNENCCQTGVSAPMLR